MEFFLPAVELVAQPSVLLAILFGTVIGTIVGVLPGLGPVVAITVCLPFTFSMGQIPAIALMLSVYCTSTYGGSISAVLINTPGTPASAATCLDGFPMTKRGKADRALGWVTIASVIGGLFSVVVLIFAAPQLAAIALKFGPQETFALIVLAMTCMAAVSRESMVKGLLAGMIGLFLSVFGPDPITGDIRFSFGIFQLTAGFSLLPVLVGIFAFSEVFVRAAGLHPAVDVSQMRVGFSVPPWAEWRIRLGVLFKSSAIGSFVGTLPGTGAAVASFMSYAEAKRSSPRRENLGKGEPDGLIASEAANNAVTGGALVPTLALGIPGDPVTAIMMSTFIIHGVAVGVRLFVDSPVIVYTMFVSLILVNVLMLVIGAFGAQFFTRLLRVPEPLLMSMVVILTFVGSYAVRNSEFDLLVTFVAGILGFAMRRNGFPTAPVVIGLVLGPRLEENLRMGLVLSDGNFGTFFESPLVVFLFVLTAALLGWPVIRARISGLFKKK
ncbi:MAG: hypothetical protein HN403_18190 [Rhodospirillales bacterium]|jgi:putative tricarboxylic transport membrane protein|nr:hypothetical protein [Rhodospirillales bacterium]